jgi:hypothetical protein
VYGLQIIHSGLHRFFDRSWQIYTQPVEKVGMDFPAVNQVKPITANSTFDRLLFCRAKGKIQDWRFKENKRRNAGFQTSAQPFRQGFRGVGGAQNCIRALFFRSYARWTLSFPCSFSSRKDGPGQTHNTVASIDPYPHQIPTRALPIVNLSPAIHALLRGLTPAEAVTMAVAVGAGNVEAAYALSGLRSWDATRARVAGGWPHHALSLAAPG